jgi:hypothetical protein
MNKCKRVEAKVMFEPDRYGRTEIRDRDDTKLVIHTFQRRNGDFCLHKIAQIIPLQGTHCQHSHDCCGNWYAGSAIIKRDWVYGLVIIIQRWSLNI